MKFIAVRNEMETIVVQEIIHLFKSSIPYSIVFVRDNNGKMELGMIGEVDRLRVIAMLISDMIHQIAYNRKTDFEEIVKTELLEIMNQIKGRVLEINNYRSEP